jgi:hypothetical protein
MCDVNLQGWACCSERGGRAKCPAMFPFMCGDPTSGVGGTDYSCQPVAELCDDSKGGIRKCGEFMSYDIFISCVLEMKPKGKFQQNHTSDS